MNTKIRTPEYFLENEPSAYINMLCNVVNGHLMTEQVSFQNIASMILSTPEQRQEACYLMEKYLDDSRSGLMDYLGKLVDEIREGREI